MKVARMAWRSVVYHRSLVICAALGIAMSTAVITGALLLGDSLRATLRERLDARLGAVAQAVMAPRPIRTVLGDVPGAAGLRHLDGTAAGDDRATVPARILGVDDRCRRLFPDLPLLTARSAAVSPALARDLGLRVGDGLLVAVKVGHQLPAGSAFSENRHERLQQQMRVTVTAVLPDPGVGGFSLDPGLDAPRSVWLDRSWLAGVLGEDHIDVIIADASATLNPAASAALADLGIRLITDASLGQITVHSDGLVMPSGLCIAVRQAASACAATVEVNAIHLADRIKRDGGGEASYALIAAREGSGGPGPDHIDLSAWLAEDLGAAPGDRLMLQFPLAGDRMEDVYLRVHAIIADAEMVRDQAMVPVVHGLTDAERIDKWDLPYPINSTRITPRDDIWWAAHHTAPKAFIHPQLIQRLWGIGPLGPDGPWISGMRVRPAAGETLDAFATRFAEGLRHAVTPSDVGLSVQPLRQRMESQAQGNADLGGLFLGLGIVVIGAGLALASALVRLHVGQRTAEVGVLLASGWSTGEVRRLVQSEAFAMSLLGAVLGIGLGVAWAWLLIASLAAGWGGAAVAMPLHLHISATTLLIGGIIGCVTGMLAAMWGLRALLASGLRDLLAGWRTPAGHVERHWRVPLICAEAMRFPGRSMLAIGLMAATAAILVLVAAQRRGVSDTGTDGATGGYTLRLTSALPIPEDLATSVGRTRLGCSSADELVLANMNVAAFLVGPGEDISCRNPARPAQPRILGCLTPMRGFGVDQNTWNSLATPGDQISVLGDADSLRWTLGIAPHTTVKLPIRGIERELRIAGAFPGSVFAGELLMGEAAFRRCFPTVLAPTCFLIDLPLQQSGSAAAILRRRLADFGVEIRPTLEIVAAQLAVRDAYLSLFLALGGLGLLIGSGGLAVLLARSAMERRAELALLAALGRRPALMLFAGHATLLGIGLLLGLMVSAGAIVVGPPTQGAWTAAWPAILAVVVCALVTAAVAAHRSASTDIVQELRRE